MNYYAEFSTDRYIRTKFFQDINYTGTMVEIGAGPPEFYSMSKHFRETGWRCICVDPNPKFVNQHRGLGHEIYELACADFIGKSNFSVVLTDGWSTEINGISYSSIQPRYEDFVNGKVEILEISVVTLNHLLNKLSVNTIDFISVDTEGWELDVMRGFDVRKYNPKVVILENVKHTNEYSDYMLDKGYTLDHIVEYNYIFTI